MINLIIKAILIVFSVIVAYLFGTAKSFREEKQKAYGEILPPLIVVAYDRMSSNKTEFNKALMKLWLYGSKKVARKIDNAVSILHHPEKGNITEAFQEAIVEMRADIQPWPWQRLKSEDVRHLYSQIIK